MREIAVSSVLTILPFLIPFTEAIKGVPDDEADDMYVFPIYSEQDDTPEKRFGRMTYANYLVNVNLKRIAERLGMKPLTFYSARHTYASVLYHANVPMGLIAQNMGRNPAEIETYLKDRTRNVMMLLKNRNVCRCRKSSYICDVKWCRKAIGNYG
jgi:integrase